MIIIESVRLRNFRAVREAFFNPVPNGITGLFGSNGEGKSTILAGVLYSLFGVKPIGATVASLRRHGSKNDEECSASVVFQHLDQQVEVIREIRGKSNTTILNIYVDGVEASVTSVGAGDAWIRQRLGVDANGFLTAFVTRQKELDQIISATPATRKQIFEKLAGIETINEALKLARRNETDTKSSLESLPGALKDIEEAETQVKFLTDKLEKLSFTTSNLRDKLDKTSEQEKEAELQVEALKNLETQLIRGKNQLENLIESENNNNEALIRLRYLDDVEENFDVEDLRNKHREIATSITNLRQEHSAKSVSRQTLVNRNQELLTIESNLGEKLKVYEQEFGKLDPKQLIEELTSLNTEQTELNKTINQAKAREHDLNESIKLLEHAAECPTCHTTLDDPAKLVKTLILSRDDLQRQAIDAQVRLGEIVIKLGEHEAAITGADELAKLRTQLQETKESRKEVLSALPPEEEITQLQDEITKLEEERDKVAEIGKQAANVENDRKTRNELQHRISENSAALQNLKNEVVRLNKEFSPAKLERASSNLAQAKSDKQTLQTQWNESNREQGETSTRLTFANREFKESSDRWSRKQELLKAVEQNAHTTDLIDKYRRETVASLTPELSERASELINDITSGAYTEIKVDDDFNITVLNSLGDERKAGELSGGEESAVALALRLAIGLLITGGQPDFLWLDEIFTAQDADRKLSMLETIQNLPYRQVILVSHDGTAEQVSDLSILVKPDLVNGSTIEVLSGGTEEDIIEELEHEFEESIPLEFEGE